MTAHEMLRSYLESRGIRRGDFARAMGVVPSAINFWFDGNRPAALVRHKIEIWTSGVIPASAWFTETERKEIARVVPYDSARRVAARARRAAG
jgi:transcriptional regulator with XRE-family HTH domain